MMWYCWQWYLILLLAGSFIPQVSCRLPVKLFSARYLTVSPGTKAGANNLDFVNIHAAPLVSDLAFHWDLICDSGENIQQYALCVAKQTPSTMRIKLGQVTSSVSNGRTVLPLSDSFSITYVDNSFSFDSCNEELHGDTRYEWTIMFDNLTVATHHFQTALKDDAWQGVTWVGGGTLLRGLMPTPLARQANNLEQFNSIVTQASLYATGVGCFSITLNGQRVSNSVLDPGFSTVYPTKMLYRAFDVTDLLNNVTSGDSSAILVDVYLGMCKYGYLNAFCSGAHASNSDCRGFRMILNLQYSDGTRSSWNTSDIDSWQATTKGNPVRYSHLFHGEIYDARLLPVQQSSFQSAQFYNTTNKDQTGLASIPTLHTMPPIEPNGEVIKAISMTGVGQHKIFNGRFIKASTGLDVYWQANSSSEAKHHVANCEMCGADVCSLLVMVTENYLASLSNGPNFTCSMDPGISSNITSWVFDFGHNMAGYASLKLTGLPPSNTKLVLRHAEMVDISTGMVNNAYCSYPCNCGGGNCANQTDAYIIGDSFASGRWSPLHTYHGFRYVQIDGWPSNSSPPQSDQLLAHFVRSAVRSTGNLTFEQSSSIVLPSQLNALQSAIEYTQLSNIHSHPTDCPQREKRGWMGDAQWTAGEASMNFDMADLYENFALSISNTLTVGCWEPGDQPNTTSPRPVDYQCCDFQHVSFGCSETGTNFSSGTEGALPDVVPYSVKPYGGWPGDPSWQIAGVVIPWEVWKRTGDIAVALAGYDAAKANVDFLTSHIDVSTGLLEFGYYGDWLAPSHTDIAQVVSFSHILGLFRLADLAKVTPHPDDAVKYLALAQQFRARWHEKYYKNGTYGSSQTANVLGLYMQAAPSPDVKKLVADTLISQLNASEFAIQSGALGTRYLFQVLHDIEADDVAMSVLTRENEPSFNFMINNGPGTIWENWNGQGSKSHPMFCGGVGLYLYTLAGVHVPEMPPVRYKTLESQMFMVIADVMIKLPSFKTRQQLGGASFTYRGITVNWLESSTTTTSTNRTTMNITIPFGTLTNDFSVDLYLPDFEQVKSVDNNITVIRSDIEEEIVSKISGVQNIRIQDGIIVIRLLGGSFHFSS